jgi:biopolymer transport protein ExbD
MRRPPPATKLTLNLAPMVDVMMCLLIFFMLATKMVEQEHAQINLPVAPQAKEAERDQASGRMVVNIRRSADGKPVYMLREENLPLDVLISRMTDAVKFDPRLTYIVRADRSIPYRDVAVLLSGCTSAGIHDIKLGAYREEGGS